MARQDGFVNSGGPPPATPAVGSLRIGGDLASLDRALRKLISKGHPLHAVYALTLLGRVAYSPTPKVVLLSSLTTCPRPPIRGVCRHLSA